MYSAPRGRVPSNRWICASMTGISSTLDGCAAALPKAVSAVAAAAPARNVRRLMRVSGVFCVLDAAGFGVSMYVLQDSVFWRAELVRCIAGGCASRYDRWGVMHPGTDCKRSGAFFVER